MKILKRIVLCLFTTMSSHAVLAAELFNPDSNPLTIGSICPLIGNSYFLAKDSDDQVFLGSFQIRPEWSGNLTARTISPNGIVSNTINWSARDKLDAAAVTHDNRRIITFTEDGDNGTFKKVPFRWDQLSDKQKTARR